MSDLTVSFYVLMGAALLAAIVFLLTRRAKRQREEALSGYCAKNGYRLTLRNEPTAREIFIESDDWQLTSSMRATIASAEGGSSGWQRETEWICKRENPLRQMFALQVSAGSANFETLPPWIRETALGAMRLWLGDWARELASVRTAFYENGRTGVVLEPHPHAADGALEQLCAALGRYTGGLPLYLESSQAHVRIRLTDRMLDTAQQIDQLLQITKTLQY